jgi:poly-gamma-glutamate synthesis protein (capsule biosynthesis protein)
VVEKPDQPDLVTLFLCGDVMTGRGIDQILPYPGDPRLFEPCTASASDYVALAEAANGPIPKAVDFTYVWGDALTELDRRRPKPRIINLGTAVTKSADALPKGINYRMNPANLPVIVAAGIDCCVLANNHILDWGSTGLLETLDTLERAGEKGVGSGRNMREAAAPAILPIRDGCRVIVYAFASLTSGVPRSWAATDQAPGISLLPELSHRSVDHIAAEIRTVKGSNDITVVSLHWGPNWGYEVPKSQISFAHWLIEEADVDIVYGHSSHHPKAIEIYRGKLVLYGCGDFLNDYEGIGGYEAFRGDLVLMYLPAVRQSSGTLVRLTMIPFQLRKFRLHHASPADAAWLADTLTREGGRFGTRIEQSSNHTLRLAWNQRSSQ